jgi:Glycosyl transferases group 1
LDNHLHIITIDVPYPANYGGAIDTFYMIKHCAALNTKIILHCFTYGDRTPQKELEQYCEKIYYYPRKSYLQFLGSDTPFIVASRMQPALMRNLLLIDAPILCCGVHTTGLMRHSSLFNKIIIVRTANVDYHYYTQLAKNTSSFLKKMYYTQEANRLKSYEQTQFLNARIVSITPEDQQYFQRYYAADNCKHISAFHSFSKVQIQKGIGSYCLYHGNLAVAENDKSAQWLIQEVFSKINVPFKIAGGKASKSLKKIAAQFAHVSIIENPNDEAMHNLISNAQINVLPSFQNTGLKLKLLHALYNGRHCIVNPSMLHSTQLQTVCTIAETSNEWITAILQLFDKELDDKQIEKRSNLLLSNYNAAQQAKDLLNLIFE